jgi:predicted PurR-regulated permease PerM
MSRSLPNRSARRFFFLLLALAIVLFAVVVRPIANALCLATALAGVLWPLHKWLAGRLGGRRGLSAVLFVFGVILLLLLPIAALSVAAINEMGSGVSSVSDIVRSHDVANFIDKLPAPLSSLGHKVLDRLAPNGGEPDLLKALQQYSGKFGGHAAAALGATLSATGELAFQTAMMLIAFYFLLVQGDDFVRWLDDLSPLKPGQTRALMREIKQVAYAVILSTLITAAVQAAAALIGYWIARVPRPMFFAGITFIAAFIPAVGAGSICLIAAVLLLISGHGYSALFLAIWGLIVVSLIDNVVKPFLIKSGMQLNGAVVFFALIGGLSALGAVGLLLGPLFVAFFLALLRMYQRDFRPRAPPVTAEPT